MMVKFSLLVITLMTMCGLILSEKPLNILVGVSISTRSHVKGLLDITNALANRGHHIHYASPPRYLKFAKGYNVTLHELPATFDLTDSEIVTSLYKKQKATRDSIPEEFTPEQFEMFYTDHKIIFQSITDLITEEHFDIVICDFYTIGCRDAVNNKNVPMIIGMQTIHAIGIYDVPYLSYDDAGGVISLEKLSFFNRLYDFTVTWYKNHKLQMAQMSAINKSRKELGIELNYNSLGPMDKNLVLSVSFFGFELPVHTPPSLKMVGPIQSSQPQPLTKDLEEFLETRTKVIYVGFGSLFGALPEDFNDILLGMTMLLDKGVIDGVIWGLKEYEWDQPIHPSIRIIPWAPQSTILQHPSTKLFISHCGIESTFDAIFAATPIMGFPFLGDQSINSAKVEHIGIGKLYPRFESTPDKLAAFAEKMLVNSDKLYRPNLIRLQKLAELRSRHGITDGVNIIEDYAYLSQTCRPHFSPSSSSNTPCDLLHLLPASVSMGTTRAYNYDIYIFLSSLFTLLFVSSFYLLYTLFVRVNLVTKKKLD